MSSWGYILARTRIWAIIGKEFRRAKEEEEGLEMIRLKICHANAGFMEFFRSALLSVFWFIWRSQLTVCFGLFLIFILGNLFSTVGLLVREGNGRKSNLI